MAARTRVLQLAITVVNLSIIALAFTSVWPFPHGDFRVHLPSASEIRWSYSDGLVHVSAPYSIDNGWIYDVDNLTIHYRVTNSSGRELAGNTFNLGSVPAGSVTPGSLDFAVDILGQYNAGAQWMVFHDDILNFQIDVSCLYTMRLIKFDASYYTSIIWDALIRSWAIERPSALPTGSQYPIHYWLNTSDMLAGLPPAQLNVSLFGDGELLGWGATSVELGGDRQGSVNLEITPQFFATVHTSYSLGYSIRVLDFPLSGSWSYGGS